MAWGKGIPSLFFTLGIALLSVADITTIKDAHADDDFCYTTFWPSSGRVVEIEACERGGGSSSGYTILRNNTNQTINVCWTLQFGDGSTDSGCNSRLRAGAERKASCYNCNRQHRGGVVDVSWTRLEAS